MEPAFFLLWCPQGVTPPRTQFASLTQAKAAARRMAAANTGRRFYIVEAVGFCEVPAETVPFVRVGKSVAA